MSLYTSEGPQRIKLLTTVKTYPHPSKTYDELVCTAGLLEDGTWVRLYPLRFRYLPFSQQFKKYDWIELEVVKNEKDPRRESFRPVHINEGDEDIRVLGSVDTKHNWAVRKEIVLKNVAPSMCELIVQCKSENVSLGTIKPASIKRFIVEEDEREWKPKWKELFERQNLFGQSMKPLAKIPYKFSYQFVCAKPGCKSHTMSIVDWEISALYLNCLSNAGGDEAKALEGVRNRYEKEFVEDKDLYLFMGTSLEHQQRNAPNPFMIVGCFYPGKEDPTLF